MVVSPNHNVHPLTHAFIASARAAGLSAMADYNGGAYDGVALCQLAHKAGRRYSAYDAFLAPALARRNLQVATGAHATRVVFENGRANGVIVRRGNEEQTFHATRGVILAAGAFGSPQLLMLSGIGAGATLQQLGITPLYDSPEVGANLQDHPLAGIVFNANRTDTYASAETPVHLLRYLLLRRGMLVSNAVEAFAFTRSRPDVAAPDLELLFVPFEWRNEGLEPPRIHAFSIASIVVAPRSRGRVTLKSADPLTPPAIDFGLLTDPDGIDEAVLLAGMRLIRKIAAESPLAAACTGEFEPGEQVTSDPDLRAWMNTRIQTVYHPTSTCRMGSDDRSVVDPQLRVRGVNGLWVADASVMPSVPRGHPNAVVAMIANRAAAWIE
jgi:choline dehydrogenase